MVYSRARYAKCLLTWQIHKIIYMDLPHRHRRQGRTLYVDSTNLFMVLNRHPEHDFQHFLMWLNLQDFDNPMWTTFYSQDIITHHLTSFIYVDDILLTKNIWHKCNFLKRFFDHDGVIFFCFYQNGVRLKKITNLGKSCLIGTTSYAEVVLIRHDFCHVILKSCQLGTTSALSYWSRANLARLLPCHIEVVPTWHDFCHIIIFIFF